MSFSGKFFSRSMLIVSLVTGHFLVPAMAAEIESSDVLLRDGDLIVTKKDMLHYVEANIPPEEHRAILSNQDRLLVLLQNVYITRALAARADEFNVEIDEAQLEWDHDFNRDTKLVLAIQEAAVEQAEKDVDWNAWAKEVYIGESERFVTEAEVDVAHILIEIKENDDAKALALAESVHKEALQGVDFGALAKKYSSDKAANKKGGELGLFKHGAMVKPFSDVAFSMTTPNSISEPVKTQFGYHIIKFNKKTMSEKKSFKDVKDVIINTIRARMAEQTRSQLLTATRSKQGVQVNKELLEDFKNEHVIKHNNR